MSQAPDRPISAQPAAADVERDYPLWRTWVGVDRLYYGLRTQGAGLIARYDIRQLTPFLPAGMRWHGGGDPGAATGWGRYRVLRWPPRRRARR
jgi:hypothetical protein